MRIAPETIRAVNSGLPAEAKIDRVEIEAQEMFVGARVRAEASGRPGIARTAMTEG